MQWKLLRRLKTHYITFFSLIRYKESFTQLKSLKTEIEHLQHLLEKAKVKMQKDFEIWWAEQAAFNQVWIETTLGSICQSLDNLAIPLSHRAPCKVIQDSLGFWIPRCGFQIPGTRFLIFYQCNLDSRLQSLGGFRIPLAEYRIPKPSIPDSAEKNFPDSRFHKPKIPGLRNLDYFTYKGESVFALVLVSNKHFYSLVKPSSIRCCDSGYDDCFCVNTKAHCSVGHKFCNGRQRRKLSKTVFPLLGVPHLGTLIYKT